MISARESDSCIASARMRDAENEGVTYHQSTEILVNSNVDSIACKIIVLLSSSIRLSNIVVPGYYLAGFLPVTPDCQTTYSFFIDQEFTYQKSSCFLPFFPLFFGAIVNKVVSH